MEDYYAGLIKQYMVKLAYVLEDGRDFWFRTVVTAYSASGAAKAALRNARETFRGDRLVLEAKPGIEIARMDGKVEDEA